MTTTPTSGAADLPEAGCNKHHLINCSQCRHDNMVRDLRAENDRLTAQVAALTAQTPTPSAPLKGKWSLGEVDGNFCDIDHEDHGGLIRIVWRMEDDEGRNPKLEAQACAVVAALNTAALQVADTGAADLPEALYADAVKFAKERASISYVQRKCRCSYNKAERMLEQMVADGIIQTYNGRKDAALTAQAISAEPAGAGYAEMGYEQQRAIMEGERNVSLENHSKGLPTHMNSSECRAYNAGFSNGWDRCASHGQALAQPEADQPIACPTHSRI